MLLIVSSRQFSPLTAVYRSLRTNKIYQSMLEKNALAASHLNSFSSFLALLGRNKYVSTDKVSNPLSNGLCIAVNSEVTKGKCFKNCLFKLA